MAADAGRDDPAGAGAHELVVERTFAAPRDLVFEAWTTPEHLVRWFAPRDVEMTLCRLDPRPGGVIHFCHQLPSGERVWVKGSFREVAPPSRIVFVVWFVDADGRPSVHPQFPDWPVDAVFTTDVTLVEERAGSTRLRFRQVLTPVGAAELESVRRERGEARDGMDQTLDRLSEFLALHALHAPPEAR
jgi:uncharacterized protein YndB with AHSA1/START domain